MLRRLRDDALGVSREDLDLSRVGTIEATLDRLDPAAVVNCAAYTKVDRAEEEEDLATTVNGVAVGVLARWCAKRNRRLVTFSTDYVFDGTGSTPYLESSPTSPINAYGRSKRAGEIEALESGALVVRTSWVISGSHPNFVPAILRKARQGPLSVVDDQLGCPTIAGDLADATLAAISAGVGGVLHLTNTGVTTWHGLAGRAMELAGLSTTLLTPCATSDYPTAAPRPSYSVLGSERIEELGLDGLPAWESSLPGVVGEIMTWL
jgi:dTDP-4-dehydrorhamnose reductase